VALISTVLLEHIRDGASAIEVAQRGSQLLGRRHVTDDVPFIIGEIQVEGTFPDGTKLVEFFLIKGNGSQSHCYNRWRSRGRIIWKSFTYTCK
jgi:hypothetical protein